MWQLANVQKYPVFSERTLGGRLGEISGSTSALGRVRPVRSGSLPFWWETDFARRPEVIV
jgi:hypothetical protein